MQFSAKVVIYGTPVLHKRATGVKKITPELRSLIPHMMKVMEEYQGVGLAAPQIGIAQKVIIVQGPKKPFGFFNPRVIKKKGAVSEEEGCLSLPGLFAKVKRASEVEVECTTPQGERVRIHAVGLFARIFQHEIDHLEGKLIVDRVPFWKRFRLLREWRKSYESHR